MIDIYADWIANFAISGFRLDTAKHVNNEFWNRFVPAMQEQAAKSSRKDFFIFGEVYDSDPASALGVSAPCEHGIGLGFWICGSRA